MPTLTNFVVSEIPEDDYRRLLSLLFVEPQSVHAGSSI